jgi:hypothetical protein
MSTNIDLLSGKNIILRDEIPSKPISRLLTERVISINTTNLLNPGELSPEWARIVKNGVMSFNMNVLIKGTLEAKQGTIDADHSDVSKELSHDAQLLLLDLFVSNELAYDAQLLIFDLFDSVTRKPVNLTSSDYELEISSFNLSEYTETNRVTAFIS